MGSTVQGEQREGGWESVWGLQVPGPGSEGRKPSQLGYSDPWMPGQIFSSSQSMDLTYIMARQKLR